MSRGRADALRVGLNLLFLADRAGGVGRYASELPGALLAADPSIELHVFVSQDAPRELRAEDWATEVRWTCLPVRVGGPRLHVPAQFGALPPLALARRLDVLHSPANTGPVITPGVASVITLHDLIWLHRPQEWEVSVRAHRAMRVLVKHCVRHATRVFAVSHAAADDFVATLGMRREKIDVTPEGVRLAAGARHTSEQELRSSFALGSGRVLLCVAQKRPYKNLHSLIRALVELDADVVLVLPGSPTPYELRLRALANELGVAERVRFPEWVSEADLAGLYALATAFVLPSLIEGFGLPVLEAMARGVPVACSDVSALPEVVGDAALLFDPQNQQDITEATRRLLSDRQLAQQLIAAGRERARQFTWKRTGEATLAGYRRALAAGGR